MSKYYIYICRYPIMFVVAMFSLISAVKGRACTLMSLNIQTSSNLNTYT